MSHFLKINLSVPSGYINPRDDSNRAYPILEEGMPIFDISKLPLQKRILHIFNVLNWLNVESCNRYRPVNNKTFCNIYAHDLAHLIGAYLPRVWWNEESAKKILISNINTIITPVYGQTLFEMNCNRLFYWFKEYGAFFKWKEARSISILQKEVNEGTIGFIIACRDNNKAGHIAAVIPECLNNKCKRIGNKLISPLQSQAGEFNKKIFTNSNWWQSNEKFQLTNFWFWDFEKL